MATFGDCLDEHALPSVELGDLPPDCDPSWREPDVPVSAMPGDATAET